MSVTKTQQGFVFRLNEIAEECESDFWSLLVLERDLTLMTVNASSFSKEDIENVRKRYIELSMKIFGRIRVDRM